MEKEKTVRGYELGRRYQAGAWSMVHSKQSNNVLEGNFRITGIYRVSDRPVNLRLVDEIVYQILRFMALKIGWTQGDIDLSVQDGVKIAQLLNNQK